MPSQAHAVLVDIFRSAPGLTVDLLQALGIEVALPESTRLLDPTFPVTSPDYLVDLAIACDDAAGAPRLVVLVEVQLEIDPAKLRSWPLYLAAAGARFKCDACVLVVAIDPRVEAWAAAPVALGPSGSVFRALVLGPSGMPRLTPDDAKESPALAVLSALCHGKAEPDIIRIAVAAIANVDEPQGRAYFDLLRYHLGDALERALEAMMATNEHKYLSDFARKYYGEGEAKGKAEGKAEGLAAGEAKGKAEALLAVLAARGLLVSPAERQTLLECSDSARIDRWIAHAVTVESVEALLTVT
jgi:hypothetical protein